MKKILLLIVCLFVTFPVFAIQEPETPSFYAEDILNQSLLTVFSGKQAHQCQAARITPTWYLTAAHCVYPSCGKECTIEVNLLQDNLQAIAQIKHNLTYQPRVFYNKQYDPSSLKNVRYDVALIHFIPEEGDYVFRLGSKTVLEQEQFFDLLNSGKYVEAKAQWEALQKARATILVTNNMQTREVFMPLAVPDFRDGGRYYVQNYGANFYYFTELWHYFGVNFGIGRGMSGGGVIIPGGTIIGIVSANLNRLGQVVIYNEKDEPVRIIPYSSNYFMFTPISETNRSFIESTITGHKDGSTVKPHFVTITDRYAKPVEYTVDEFFGIKNQNPASNDNEEVVE